MKEYFYNKLPDIPSDVDETVTREELIEAIKIHCKTSSDQYEEFLNRFVG